MVDFRILDRHSNNGYQTRQFPNNQIPTFGTGAPIFLPWGYSQDRVIYAHFGEFGFWNNRFANERGIRRYNKIISEDRRRLCQSVLALKALETRNWTSNKVNMVSMEIRDFLNSIVARDPQYKYIVMKAIAHYYFTDFKTGFGRIASTKHTDLLMRERWDGIMDKLLGGTLDQQLSLHDAVGRKILVNKKLNRSYGKFTAVDPAQFKQQMALSRYNDCMARVRQPWFDKGATRGRRKVDHAPGPTVLGGIVRPESDMKGYLSVNQPRDRAVDQFEYDPGRTPHPEADQYYTEAAEKNLIFGGGISGTTGTLLAAAHAFGKISNGEPLKEYTLAIIAYLVGGGMHSYHECMVIANKVGVPYDPGLYEGSLPQNVKQTQWYRDWKHRFYDIAVLGNHHHHYAHENGI
ncbi:MAG: hypothetical protein AAF667_18745 [Pseudomonadota bacterium]